MKLSLDHQQRLNLIALVGMQKGTVAEIRVFWKIIDKLELSAAEKLEIGYQIVIRNGLEAVQWDVTKRLEHRDFEITDGESQMLRRIVEEYPDFRVVDRGWVESFLDQFSPVFVG